MQHRSDDRHRSRRPNGPSRGPHLRRLARSAIPLLLAAAGCGEDGRTYYNPGGDADTDTDIDVEPHDFSDQGPWFVCPSEDALPAGVVEVPVFDQESQYFVSGTDLRTVEQLAALPGSNRFKQIGLWIKLDCPTNGKCDAWDRTASVSLVAGDSDPDPAGTELELARYITPYGLRMCSYVDVTPLAARLTAGPRTIRSFIDTWVGPGHTDGSGWRTTVRLLYYPLDHAPSPPEVINVWSRRSITLGQTAEEGESVDEQIEPVTVTIPADATRVEAWLRSTGHGFNNSYNCAEFCELTQHVIVNGTHFEIDTWRDDCENNPLGAQPGTWDLDRQGWCPGTIAPPHAVDVTAALTPGEAATIDLDIRRPGGQEYVDTSGGDWPYQVVSLQLLVTR